MPPLPNAPNAACDMLGCRLPIVLAGMGGVARSELVSAVTAAGGFGFLGMVREPVALIEREVARVRAAGHERFGVNVIPAATEPELLRRQVDAIIALGVPVVELFWEIDARVVARLRDAGVVVVYQVGSASEAVTAERAGAQIIVAQGDEAGGHVRGIKPLRALLPAVMRAVKVPVLAAGGLATGTDLVTALALGADGIVLGTALMATPESFAHPYHQQRLVEAEADDTVLTGSFHINWPPNAPVRVLKSPVTALGPDDGARQVIGDEEGRPIYLFSTDSPLKSMTGDFASMALYAGTGVGEIKAIEPAGMRIAHIMEEARSVMPVRRPVLARPSSSVCYAGEMSGAYQAEADRAEVDDMLAEVTSGLAGLLDAMLAERADDGTQRPPFGPEVGPIAAWLLTLRTLCAEAGVPAAGPARIDAGEASASIRRRLARTLPRMADDAVRQTLSELGSFLSARFARSAENQAASGR